MKKFILLLILLFTVVTVAWAADDYDKKAEFRFHIGRAFTLVDASSSYSDTWSWLSLSNVQESGTINGKSKDTLFVGASVAYYFSQYIGIQAGFGYLKADVPNDVSFDFNWTWLHGGGDSRHADWRGTGEIRVVPININGIARYNSDSLCGYISGGYTIFNNKFKADSYMGAGYSVVSWYWWGYYQWVDAFQVPLAIDESWTGHGMNIGGGVDFNIYPNVAITADIRYYYCPSKDFNYIWKTDTYRGYFFEEFYIYFDSERAELHEADTTPFTINPSFFQIATGIKFFF